MLQGLAFVPQLCHGVADIFHSSHKEEIAVKAMVSCCREGLPQGACSGTCASSAQLLSTWTSSATRSD